MQHSAQPGADAGERSRAGVGVGGFDHVDQIDVGNVVQFLGAELAHADDAEPASRAVRGLMPGDGERRFERGIGEIRQRLADSRLNVAWLFGGGVDGDDCGKLAAVGGAQTVGRLRQRQG